MPRLGLPEAFQSRVCRKRLFVCALYFTGLTALALAALARLRVQLAAVEPGSGIWMSAAWLMGVTLVIAIAGGCFGVYQWCRREAVEQREQAERERSQALEHSARESEERLRALIHSIPDLIFVFDEQDRFVFVHASDESQLLMPVEELLGSAFADVLPDELAALLTTAREKINAESGPVAVEYQLVVDGKAHEFSARLSALTDQSGQRSGFLAVVREVTESKIQEAELRIASTAFETHLGIIITDANGLILKANRAFTRITGYEEHEVVGKTPGVLQSGLQNRTFYQQFWHQVREAGSWEGEIWNRKKSGELYAEWLTVTAVRGDSGRILNYVGTFHDITRRKEAERQAHRLAFYDSLTGLANRALMEDRIGEVLKQTAHSQTKAALLELELNQFRTVNDTRGYEVGDRVLRAVAERLGRVIEGSNTLARTGGDEFAVLVPDLGQSREQAARRIEALAEQLVALFEKPFEVEGHSVPLDVNVGISLMNGEPTTWDQQIQRVEQATQQAKLQAREQGVAPIAFFDPELQASTVQTVLLENELRGALANNELQLFFQPQVRHPDQWLGYEVLLRWQHPDRGMVSPGVFIPLAEHSRLIVPIGEWVLRQACEQLARWQADPQRCHLHLAVNVSVYQFQSPKFVDQLALILQETGAPAHQLELEVTESLLMNDPDRITRVMQDLRALGIRFSLDDFGTGYSSLAYLKRLPLDEIKIDQSFVRELGEGGASEAIVDSIIGLSRGLNLRVLAEGVETEAQQQWLVAHGCDTFQGYRFGRPAPLEPDA